MTIGSALFALSKRGLIDEAELKDRTKAWKKYRAKNDLDPHGRKRARSPGVEQLGSCC